MLNEEDPVGAAIPPGRTAGRTAARAAVTAADLHRPVPRRQGTRGARHGTPLLAAPPPACPRLRLAANQLITFHHPDISFRGPQALKVRTGMSVR
jgi:hypothetical protein